MKRPTRKQVHELAVVIMRGVNAVMIWMIFAALVYAVLVSMLSNQRSD